MLNNIDWHLNCNWMSQFLTFQDLNALSLTGKHTASFANGARMLKVKKWERTANEGEKVWISHYKQNFPSIKNPASLYLKCLRYRHICSDHFRDIVLRDPRLTEKQQAELVSLSLDVQPSKLFYWFVVDLLPIRPLRINFSLSLLKKALHLPFGQKIIRKTSLGNVFVFINKRGHIVISNNEGLLAVVTDDRHLWMTRLWDENYSVFLNVLCCDSPERIITSYSSYCPFCGLDVCSPCAHTTRCLKNYARWSAGLLDYCEEITSK